MFFYCKIFTSLDEALASGLFDVAIVMTPHNLHEEHAIKCLEAGKHVLVEKPVTHTLESAKRLLAVAEKSKQLLVVAENSMFWPEVTRAQDN